MHSAAAVELRLRDFDRYRDELTRARRAVRTPPTVSPAVFVAVGVFAAAASFAFLTPAVMAAEPAGLIAVGIPLAGMWAAYAHRICAIWRRRRLRALAQICAGHAARLAAVPGAADPEVAARLVWFANTTLDGVAGWPPAPHVVDHDADPDLSALASVAGDGPLLDPEVALVLASRGPARRHFAGDHTALAMLVSSPFDAIAVTLADVAVLMRGGASCRRALSRTWSSDHDNLAVAAALRRLVAAGPDALRVAAALDDTAWQIPKLVDTAVMLASEGHATTLAA